MERPLLSRNASSSLNLIQKVNEIDSKEKPFDSVAENTKLHILEKYPKLFEGLGELHGEYIILIKPNAKPYALHVPRKVPLPLLDKTKKELDKMLDMGVISRAEGHTSWCAPMVVTPKPFFFFFFFYIQYKILQNEATQGTTYELLNYEDDTTECRRP